MKGSPHLQLSQREAPPQSLFGVVFDGWAVYNGAQRTTDRAREDPGSLFGPPCSSLLLPCGLIEPAADTELPLLVEVGVRDNVVVLCIDIISDIEAARKVVPKERGKREVRLGYLRHARRGG